MTKRKPSRMEALAVLRGEQAHYLSWSTELGNCIASALGTTIEVLEGDREPSGPAPSATEASFLKDMMGDD